MQEIAKQFWQNQEVYPEYGTIKQRRLYELNYLVPKVFNKNSLLDLGCGDGSLIKCLKELTNIKLFYGYDFSINLLKDIPAITKYYDCYDPKELPETDVTVFSGVIPFIFKDEIIHSNLELIKSDLVYIKAPCSMENQSIFVNDYSEKLQSKYSSLYRTVPEMINIIKKHFKIIEINKIYPDEIESEFGTKQIAFICKI
jgi:trans-aconitate methyltransferase